MKPLVFLCMPRYGSSVDARAHRSFLAATRGMCDVSFGTEGIGGSPIESQTSVLTQAFNQPWVMALNLRDVGHKVTHWAMQHADVEPLYGWLDVLVSEQKRLNADIVSAVIPFKMPTGITSTALGMPSWELDRVDPAEKPRRLTMTEAHKLPKTFAAPDAINGLQHGGFMVDGFLMVNTGCWVCRFDRDWVEKITFRFLNLNYRIDSATPGKRWHTACRSEDFDFSMQAHKLGLSVYATTAVEVQHHGDCSFPNNQPWGLQQTDDEWLAHMKANQPMSE